MRQHKLFMDQFQNMLILNSVTVRAKRLSENPCGLFDFHFEIPWVTKLSDELDMTDLDILPLLRQVSYNVNRYGNILSTKSSNGITKDVNRDGTTVYPLLHGVNALLSYDIIVTGPPGGVIEPNIYTTVGFAILINCEIIPISGSTILSYNHQTELESIDFQNIESISIKSQSARGGSPVIMINTIDGKIIKKPKFQKFLTFATFQDRPKTFYMPKYETEKQKNDPVPDLRSTIHWEPNIITDENGQATFSFYNADRPNRIRITVEGINSNSSLGFAQKDYRILTVEGSRDN